MRIVQSYLFNDGTSEEILESLVASAIQWQSVFLEDTLVFYSTLEFCTRLAEYCKKVNRYPWAEINPTLNYSGKYSDGFYDASRFLASQQVSEPFMFLDLDAWLFLDQPGVEDFNLLLNQRKAFLENPDKYYFVQMRGIAREYRHRYFSVSKLPREYLDNIPFKNIVLAKNYETTNSGVFMASPKLAVKIGQEVIRAMEQLSSLEYSSNLHEFISGTIPISVAKQSGVEICDLSASIRHFCGIRNLLEDLSGIDFPEETKVRFFRTVCKKIIVENRNINYEELLIESKKFLSYE